MNWEFFIAQAVLLLGVILAYLQLRRDRQKEMTAQVDRHSENISRLNSLREFQAMQLEINKARGEEMTELKVQTARLVEIATGQARRLVMLEDRPK